MKKVPFLLICVCVIILMSSITATDRYGVIFLSDLGGGNIENIYRISDTPKAAVEQLTFLTDVADYHLLVSKKGGKIVFTDIKGGPIYFLDVTNKKLVYITAYFSDLIFDITVPADWTLDENQFAIISRNGDKEGFPGIMDFNGTNKNYLTLPAPLSSGVDYMKWSPDGKELAFSRSTYWTNYSASFRDTGTYVYNLASMQLRQLTSYAADCFDPQWSPTGQQIVVTCQMPDAPFEWSSNLSIINISDPYRGYGQVDLSPCRDPAWSPDGGQLVFACQREGVLGLYVVNSSRDGLHEIRLDNFRGYAFIRYPTWSPDGRQIVYVAGDDAEHANIFSVNSDGSNDHLLTRHFANYHDLSVYPLP